MRFDFDAIGRGLKKLRGEVPSGRYFAPVFDAVQGKEVLSDIGPEHDWVMWSGVCARCGASMTQAEGFPKLARCPGKPVEAPPQLKWEISPALAKQIDEEFRAMEQTILVQPPHQILEMWYFDGRCGAVYGSKPE